LEGSQRTAPAPAPDRKDKIADFSLTAQREQPLERGQITCA
jgi:hypothetical protein